MNSFYHTTSRFFFPSIMFNLTIFYDYNYRKSESKCVNAFVGLNYPTYEKY